jgi:hypothetical protein
MLDRLELAAALTWFLVALVALGNAGLSLLPGVFLLGLGTIAGLGWLLRSAVLASKPPAIHGRARTLRWFALPAAFIIVAGLGTCDVGPLLRLRFALSESAFHRYRNTIGFRPQVEPHLVERRIGLFWVWTMWTDGGRCWRFITGYGVYSFHGLTYCRSEPWPTGSRTHRVHGGWFAWRTAPRFAD